MEDHAMFPAKSGKETWNIAWPDKKAGGMEQFETGHMSETFATYPLPFRTCN